MLRGGEGFDRGRNCDWRRLAHWISVRACRDRGKRQRGKSLLVGQPHGFAVTACQSFSLAVLAAAINRTHRVNDVFCGKLSAGSDHGLSSGQRSNPADDLAAFGQDRRASCTMNRAIHSASAQQGRIRGIHNRVGGFFGDIGRAMRSRSSFPRPSGRGPPRPD